MSNHRRVNGVQGSGTGDRAVVGGSVDLEGLRAENLRLLSELSSLQESSAREMSWRNGALVEMRMLIATLVTGQYQMAHLFVPQDMGEAGRRIEAMMTAQLGVERARAKVSESEDDAPSEGDKV